MRPGAVVNKLGELCSAGNQNGESDRISADDTGALEVGARRWGVIRPIRIAANDGSRKRYGDRTRKGRLRAIIEGSVKERGGHGLLMEIDYRAWSCSKAGLCWKGRVDGEKGREYLLRSSYNMRIVCIVVAGMGIERVLEGV